MTQIQSQFRESFPDLMHDLKSVCKNFEIIARLLRDGYRFSDDEWKLILVQLETSIGKLEKALRTFEK